MINPPRPGILTALCIFAIIGALFESLTAMHGFWGTDDPDVASWVDAHQQSVRLQIAVVLVHASVVLLSCYFMMQAKNWARWTYLGWTGIWHVLALGLLEVPLLHEGITFLRFRAGMVPGMLFFVAALVILFLPRVREYFEIGDRPWWQREQEDEEGS